MEASDVGLLDTPARQAVPFSARASTRMPAPGEPPLLDFEPVKQSVTAQVEARFTMVLPEAAAEAD